MGRFRSQNGDSGSCRTVVRIIVRPAGSITPTKAGGCSFETTRVLHDPSYRNSGSTQDYCKNWHTRSLSPQGPIYGSMYDGGTRRVPWFGSVAPETGVQATCVVCGAESNKGWL